ncbi:superoxide dismutase, Fe-Mn family [Dehalogenimonas formicexedens]|uniref:superoxide dismutase n=1 Tax=Dehalogenimonas formicexedens TaxID=1839801 RepID=A0A1P8F872_9CHLR|nr:Fe-Mn family superoxide dismutase [Dehalogenimonas formicexedens]APV44640.1 superoxide dismutase, Fe-Mn family [Dehalogenimonas formicexedens]
MYTATDFNHLKGMPGFSETLLNNHFTLYQGYIKNTNKLFETLDALSKAGKSDTPEFAELQRRFGFEWNGMRLHELYFGNLGGDGLLAPAVKLEKKLAEAWGSREAWEKDFRAVGSLRGVGWAVLYQDPVSGALFNCWINLHESGHLAGCNPLLVMDVWEHAFMIDYGLKRADYIDAFFKNIDWAACEKRLK